jgi:ABC-2 type transport system permease protein
LSPAKVHGSLVSAAWLIVWASAKNRLRRLFRQPRYLVFSLVGAAYLFTVGGRRWLGSSASPPGMPHVDPGQLSPGLVLGVGAAAFVYLAGVWLFGSDTVALQFTEAEVQFLFPAPITRRKLVHYKLVRILLGALVAGPIVALLLRRASIYGAVGFFFAFAVMSLHRVCASMTRASLLEHGVSGLRRRIVTLSVLAAVLAGVAWSISRTAATLPHAHGLGVGDWTSALSSWADEHERPLRWALFPVVALMRVASATTPAQLLAALPAALLVLAVHYVWAVSTSVAFEESAADAAEKRARRMEAARAGRVGPFRRGPPLFRLAGTGAPWVAIAWKNLLAGTRVSRRQLIIWAIAFFIMPVTMAVAMHGQHGVLLPMLGIVPLVLAPFIAIIGPHAMRNDLRMDIDNIDILRSYPLSGRHMLLGELLAPLGMLAVIEWALLVISIGVNAFVGGKTEVAMAFAGGGMIAVLPALTACGLVLRNLIVLILPSWAAPSAQETRGLEVFGQRLLVMVGTLVVLGLVLVPAGAVGMVVAILLGPSLGIGVVPIVCVVAAAVAIGEAYLALGLLGRAFERFDLTQR